MPAENASPVTGKNLVTCRSEWCMGRQVGIAAGQRRPRDFSRTFRRCGSRCVPASTRGRGRNPSSRLFRASLPLFEVTVYDNNLPTDRQVARARAAEVRSERRQGKGQCGVGGFRRRRCPTSMCWSMAMTTYTGERLPRMLEKLVCENLDMRSGHQRIDQRSGRTARHRAETGC